MNASPATVARQINVARKVNRVSADRLVYRTSTPVVVAPVVMYGPAEFVGPCGCSGCEKWADCYYCGTCSPETA